MKNHKFRPEIYRALAMYAQLSPRARLISRRDFGLANVTAESLTALEAISFEGFSLFVERLLVEECPPSMDEKVSWIASPRDNPFAGVVDRMLIELGSGEAMAQVLRALRIKSLNSFLYLKPVPEIGVTLSAFFGPDAMRDIMTMVILTKQALDS